HQLLQRALARVAERRMPEVVREADGLDEVAVDVEVVLHRSALGAQVMADRAADLRDFHRVREARAVEVGLAGEEDLRLRLQFSKRVRVDDAVAVDLERVAIVGLSAGAERLAVERVIKPVGHRERWSTRTAPCTRCNLAMPHATFVTPLGTCAIAWNDSGLTRFL